jgi:hypothetical protein
VNINTGAMEHHISSQFKVFLFGIAGGHTEITNDEGLRGTIGTQKEPQPHSYESVTHHLGVLEEKRTGTVVSAKLPGQRPTYDLKVFKK